MNMSKLQTCSLPSLRTCMKSRVLIFLRGYLVAIINCQSHNILPHEHGVNRCGCVLIFRGATNKPAHRNHLKHKAKYLQWFNNFAFWALRIISTSFTVYITISEYLYAQTTQRKFIIKWTKDLLFVMNTVFIIIWLSGSLPEMLPGEDAVYVWWLLKYYWQQYAWCCCLDSANYWRVLP